MTDSILVGKIDNSIMIGTVNKSLLNVTEDECICEMMKTNVLFSGLNYFSTNETCQLFYSDNNSIVIEFNLNSDFMFINQSAISITNKPIVSLTTTSTTSSTSLSTTSSSTSTTTTTTTNTTTAVPTCGPSVCCSAANCSACVYSNTIYYCTRYESPNGYNIYTGASNCTNNGASQLYCNYNTICGTGAGHPGVGSGNGC